MEQGDATVIKRAEKSLYSIVFDEEGSAQLEITEDQRRELSDLLRSEAGIKALTSLAHEATETEMQALRTADLRSTDGALQLIEARGHALGIRRAISVISNLLEEETRDE